MQIAGRQIKPSDILALRNNFKGCNPYISAAYPEPPTSVLPVSSTAQAISHTITTAPKIADGNQSLIAANHSNKSNSIKHQSSAPINIVGNAASTTSGHMAIKATSANNSVASSPLAAVTAMSPNTANINIPSSVVVDVQSSILSPSNISHSNNSTNQSNNNQSSLARKKNRRIGRHESRYTSGNFLFVLFLFLSCFVFNL